MSIYLCLLILGINLLLFIFVSGIKNKKGFCNYSSEAMQSSQDVIIKKVYINDEFLYWFSGFTEGEGNFLITIDRNYVKLRFKISLHIDDLKVIEIIQSNLNIGRITKEKKIIVVLLL